MAKQIKIEDSVNELLDKLSSKRKDEGSFIRTKQDIVKELVMAQAKRELKQHA